MSNAHPPRREARKAKHREAARGTMVARSRLPSAVLFRATVTLVIATGALLTWTAFAHHPVGDFFTESDFYGGYAHGARLVQQGRIDFSRYSVVGPLHELMLAAVGWLTHDLFTAARLISIGGAVATLALWTAILRKRGGGAIALLGVALIATNSSFFRYGYSATTEMLSLAFQAACLYQLLARSDSRAPFAAGLFAALASLTRYSGLVLLPAGLLSLVWLAPIPGLRERRAALLFLLGFALPAGVWTALSIGAGHAPGANLIQGFAFYANPSTSRNIQDAAGGLEGGSKAYGLGSDGLGDVLSPVGLARNALDHLRENGRDLLGAPVALPAALGLLLMVRDRRVRHFLPLLLPAAFLFVALIPVFYSNRYALALVPAYATLAAYVADSSSFALLTRRLRFPLMCALLGWALFGSARASAAHQQWVRSQLPVEVLELGPKLRRAASPASKVVARKGQIGYYAGMEVVFFPRAATLAELAQECGKRQADFLYFSWYEAELRPEFWHLLDTTGTVPGLEVVCATDGNPAVVYRIGSGFGTEPWWFANDTLRHVHASRARVKVLPETMVWRDNVFLAAWDAQHGDLAGAQAGLEAALRVRPDDRAVQMALDRVRRARVTP